MDCEVALNALCHLILLVVAGPSCPQRCEGCSRRGVSVQLVWTPSHGKHGSLCLPVASTSAKNWEMLAEAGENSVTENLYNLSSPFMASLRRSGRIRTGILRSPKGLRQMSYDVFERAKPVTVPVSFDVRNRLAQCHTCHPLPA